MVLPGDLDALCPTELKALVVQLLGKVAALEQTVAAQRAEIVRLKGLKGRPQLKPSGMEKASEPKPSRSEERRVGKECRSLCDWSSDVCSSDLDGGGPACGDRAAERAEGPPAAEAEWDGEGQRAEAV